MPSLSLGAARTASRCLTACRAASAATSAPLFRCSLPFFASSAGVVRGSSVASSPASRSFSPASLLASRGSSAASPSRARAPLLSSSSRGFRSSSCARGLKTGIVGLPNVGKSTLFNALCESGHAQAGNFPFCTIDPNVGVVPVPDARLAVLGRLTGADRLVPATVDLVDVAGLVEGASKGEGLGNRFLATIRECDAIAQVVRCFDAPGVTHVRGEVSPRADVGVIGSELALADLAQIERRKAKKKGKKKGGAGGAGEGSASFGSALGAPPSSGPPASAAALAAAEDAALDKLEAALAEGLPARRAGLTDLERLAAAGLGLLTLKPQLFVANVAEADLGGPWTVDDVIRVAEEQDKGGEGARSGKEGKQAAEGAKGGEGKQAAEGAKGGEGKQAAEGAKGGSPASTSSSSSSSALSLSRALASAMGNAHLAALCDVAAEEGARVVVVSAQIEAELRELEPEMAREYLLEVLGGDRRKARLLAPHLFEEGAGDETAAEDDAGSSSLFSSVPLGSGALVRAAYQQLGLLTYFTSGEIESRAWTVRAGTRAPQAAGVIHTDFEKQFIRAEVVAYDDFVRAGGWAGARELGAFRSEGKDYVVHEGDVVLFRTGA